MEETTIKIVVCDDHAVYRQGIKHVLASKPDVEVIGEAQDGLQLLKLLKHVEPDLILLDINMPVMDGTVAITQVKKEYPDIKVLVLSMQNTPQMIKIMMSLGADGYLTKNDDEEIIYTAIKNCVESGRYINKRTEDVLIASVRNIKPYDYQEDRKDYKINYVDDAVEKSPIINKKGIYDTLKYALKGLGVALVIIICIYLYRGISSIKNPMQEYTPTIEESK